MGMTLVGFLLPLLLVLPVIGADLRNGTLHVDARAARASKRVVRLYSGTRPKPIVCEHEGFQADPTDCTIFHRCMKNGNGRYVSFKFQCGPGTIYDPDTEICNHPQSTKRTECGGSLHIPSVEYAFDNEINREVPSPISTRHPENTENVVGIHDFSTQTTKRPKTSSFASKYPWALTTHLYSNVAVSTSPPFVNKHQETEPSKAPSTKRQVPSSYFTTPFSDSQKLFSTTAKIDFQNPLSNLQSGDLCIANGFMGDSENCRKFYRCISNQRGGFIRYEFLCNDPTIWDEDKKACNHAWAVTKRRCGRESFIDTESKKTVMKVTISELTTTSQTTSLPTQSQLQINYGSKVTQTQTQISDGSIKQNQTQINYGNDTNIKNDNIVQNQTQISHGNAVSQTQTQMNYGNEAVQTQLQIDHSKEASQAQMQISQSSSTKKTTQYSNHQMVSTTSSNNGCTESGFMGDSKDCKKFYRCVDNGKGGFTRYEFSCGEGTVWDPNLEACNHAWAVKECGGKASSGSTTQSTTKITQSTTKVSEIPSTFSTTTSSTTSPSTQNNNYHSTTESENEDNNDIGYGHQSVSPATAKPAQQATTEYKEPQSPSDNKCKSSGFMGDNKDCKKFYRCVDNGNGGYTRYEFSCGEGTVWDQTIEACNHAWAVKTCGKNAEFEHPTDKSTTTNIVSTTSSQASPQNDDFDTGYGLQPSNDEPSSTIKPTTVKSTTTALQSSSSSDSSIGNICTSSGFMGDNNECKKFYRCVENGNGGYTRYEFSCGEGTVWDPKIQSCNHAWAVEKCGGNSEENVNKVESTTQKELRPPLTSTQSNEPDDNNGSGYGPQTQEPQLSTSTTYDPENHSPGINKCSTSGFMGDPNDCKKFYRCVDNGDGTFTRYEFSCGEGTVWDSKIDACNHAWAVESCGSTSSSTTSTTSSTMPINNEEHSNDYPVLSDEYPSQTTISTGNTLSTTSSSNVDNYCKNSGFMGDTQDCKKFYRCVEDGNGKYTRYEFACSEGTVWDESIEACNHAWAVSRHCSDQGHSNQSSNVQLTTQPSSSSETENEDNKPNTEKPSTSTVFSEPSGYECTKEGFYGDNNNCKKFYRCVDNGQGGFIKYEFTCSEGTVWNQDVQTCDHETSDSKCSSPAPVPTTNKPNYEQDTILPESTTKILESSTTNNENTSQKPQSSGNKCENEGFYGDPNDCKKFYRCVDDSKGGFIKYDFTCGDGTIWDQEILACNHESSNSKCTSSNMNIATTSSATDTGSGSSSSTQESQTTPKPESTSSGSDKCAMGGFFANTNDCKKFYRCVDNGKGGFTKYDFTCGEGTVWVQEIQTCDYDNDISSCSNNDGSSNPQDKEEKPVTTESSPTGQATTVSQPLDKEDDEYSSESSSKPSNTNEKCTSEGFFGNKNDCTRFYRCVDNGQGGYTKYDFTCGEGTAWDSNIQTCNHKGEVESCQKTEQEISSDASHDEGSSQTTGSTGTGNEPTSSDSSKPSSNDKCEQEGFFGNSQDCTKFYRCVDNGNGGLTKYDFSCGEGTIWDQDLTTCNHPQDVANQSCKNGEDNQSSSEMPLPTGSSSSSSASSSSTSPQTSEGTTENNNQGSSNCSQETSSKKPEIQSIKCEKAGFFGDPNDCKKFYRCVDWDGDGTRFSIYHFDCGEGTIWDPQLETCNHEDSVYPPRDCSGTQSANTSQETTSSTTTEQSSTTESTTTQSSTEESTTQQSSSSEQTTQQTTTEYTTTQEPSTSEITTTEKTTTTTTTTQEPSSSEKTTTQQSTSSEKTTTQQTTSEPTTTEQTTTSQQTTQETITTQQTTTQQTSSSEQTTTEHTTSAEQTTTQQTTDGTTTTQQITDGTTTTQQTTDETTTTQQTATSEQTTQQTTTAQESSTTDETTTEQQTTTTEKASEQSTTQQQTTTGQESTTTESTTTESSQGTTSQETSSAEKDCPETEDDQYMYVCPTSFRRHPKYCNMFYQCTEDNDSHDVKIATFKCPNNTIYDESKSQCVEEDKADKKCNGQTAQKHRVKRLNLNYKEPIEARPSKHTCSGVGYYPYEENECSGIFFKCESTKAGKLRGYVYRCPEGYTYWSISKRCEKRSHMKGCKQSDKSWRDRWEIPVEKKNIAQ